MRHSFLLPLLLLLGGAVLASDPAWLAETDRLSDDALLGLREAKVTELAHRAGGIHPERTRDGAIYRTCYCSVYYTPRESGFRADRGFDTTPILARGLGKHPFARSFLAAVKREGFGRVAKPVNGHSYIQYYGQGIYLFAKAPVDSLGDPLVARQTCAISPQNPFLKRGRWISIDSPTLQEVMGGEKWKPTDRGSALQPLQIDLYWGEDEPRGPNGRQRARPSGTMLEYAFDVAVKVRDRP
jgi:hypothetical protein